MDVEAGDGVHHGLRRDVDRHRRRRQAQRVGEALQPVFQHQHGFRLEARCRKQHVEHDLALGDEAALPADEIAFADRKIGCDARIGRIVDADEFHVSSRPAFQRASSSGIRHHGDGGERHGGAGQHRRQQARRGQRNADQVVDEGPAEILPDGAAGLAGDVERGRHEPEVGPHQRDGRRLARDIRARRQRDAEPRGRQRRAVVDAVADEGDRVVVASAAKAFRAATFSSGSRRARISSMPTAWPMASAAACVVAGQHQRAQARVR